MSVLLIVATAEISLDTVLLLLLLLERVEVRLVSIARIDCPPRIRGTALQIQIQIHKTTWSQLRRVGLGLGLDDTQPLRKPRVDLANLVPRHLAQPGRSAATRKHWPQRIGLCEWHHAGGWVGRSRAGGV